jgi:hypothetical protein
LSARSHIDRDISTWGLRDSPFQTILDARAAAVIGVAGAIASVAIARVPALGLAIGCTSILLLYSIYTVFSFAWNDPHGRTVEAAYALIGILTITLAIALDPRWLALGWAMHALWDLLHHRDHHIVGLRGIPMWWIQGCLVWDLLAAAGIILYL